MKTPRPAGAFLDDPISGKNKDSLVYDVRNKMVYIYNEGDITYQNSNLKADYMQINMDNKMVYAYGKPDSLEGKPIVTKPEFPEGDASYTMDTITYNLTSKKAKIKGVATQQGDGWLVGGMSLVSLGEGLSFAVLYRFALTASQVAKGTVSASVSMLSMIGYAAGLEGFRLVYAAAGPLGFVWLGAAYFVLYLLFAGHSVRRAMRERAQLCVVPPAGAESAQA